MRTLVAANPSWNLAAHFNQTNFRPLTLTCCCPFIVQVLLLQVVPFGHLSYELSLSYPFGSHHIFIPRTAMIGANS